MKRFVLALAFGAAAMALAVSAAGRSNVPALRATSTLDGRKALPTVIRWLVRVNVPAANVTRVEFLIDGKLRGVEHEAPYNYGSDDFHGHLGSLVTSWLSPGIHRFVARVHTTDGRTAQDVVRARVLPAPLPPAALAGAWERTVTATDAETTEPGSTANFPVGMWKLIFDRVGVWELDPQTSGIAEHATFTADTIKIDAALWLQPATADGHNHTSRYGHSDYGTGWREDGPPATYHWAVSGDQLTLTAIQETMNPAIPRRAIWEGVWTRVK